MRSRILLAVFIVAALPSCGGEEFAEANELESYRMIGLAGVRSTVDERPESPAPDLYLDEIFSPDGVEVSIQMVDFDPEGADRRYRHTLCLSVGAPTRFECLAPESALRCGHGVEASEGCVADGPRAVFQLNLATTAGLLAILGGDPGAQGETGDQGADCAAILDGLGSLVEAAQAGCPVSFPIPIIVRTEVIGPDESIKVAARSVKVRLPQSFLETALSGCDVTFPSTPVMPSSGMDQACMEEVDGRARNRNPSVTAITVGDRTETEVDSETGCLRFPAAGVIGAQVPISVSLSPCSVERFLAYSTLDGCVVRSEADLGPAAMTFYADSGELLFGNRRLEEGETKLTLPLLPGLTRLYVAVRDGRNGLDVACADIESVSP